MFDNYVYVMLCYVEIMFIEPAIILSRMVNHHYLTVIEGLTE